MIGFLQWLHGRSVHRNFDSDYPIRSNWEENGLCSTGGLMMGRGQGDSYRPGKAVLWWEDHNDTLIIRFL